MNEQTSCFSITLQLKKYLSDQHATKCYTRPKAWRDSLERPKRREMDVRFWSRNVGKVTENSSNRMCHLVAEHRSGGARVALNQVHSRTSSSRLPKTSTACEITARWGEAAVLWHNLNSIPEIRDWLFIYLTTLVYCTGYISSHGWWTWMN